MEEELKDSVIKQATQESLEQIEDSSPNETEAQLDGTEIQAKEKGWVPKEEFQGDPETWVEAKEFVAREPLYKALHSANRKIKKMQETLDTFREHYTKVEIAAKEKAIKELQSQLDVASEERDVGKALQIKDKIVEVQNEKASTEKVSNTVFDTWVEENTWYNSDPVLKTTATGIGFGLAQEHPDWTVGKVYQEVTKIIKESFPDKFSNSNKAKPNKVGTSAKTTLDGGGKRTYSVRHLPEEARRNYNKLVKSERNPHGILSNEEWFKDYVASGGSILNAD